MKTAITEDDLKDAFKVLDKQGTGTSPSALCGVFSPGFLLFFL